MCRSRCPSETGGTQKMRKPLGLFVRQMIPNMAIHRIRWLHDDKTQEERKKSGKTGGTVIINFLPRLCNMRRYAREL